MKLAFFARFKTAIADSSSAAWRLNAVFHHPPSFRSQVQNLSSPVAWRRAASDETLFLQAIDGSGHRAAGQQHLALDFRDRQRTLMQKRFKGREIGEAQSGFLDAALRDLAQRSMAPRKNQPQARCVHLTWRS